MSKKKKLFQMTSHLLGTTIYIQTAFKAQIKGDNPGQPKSTKDMSG